MKNLTVLLLVPFMIQSARAQDSVPETAVPTEQTSESRRFINPALFLKKRPVEEAAKSDLVLPPVERTAELPERLPTDYYRAAQDTQETEPVVPQDDQLENAQRITRPLSDNPLADLRVKTHEEGGELRDEVPADYALDVYGAYSNATLGTELRQIDYVIWDPQAVCWQAPNFYHWPLYFEDEATERYGHCVSRFPVARSAAHFFTQAVFLPYSMGIHGKCERRYTLGYLRPGSYNPLCGNKIPVNARAIGFMSIKTAAAAVILP